MDFRYQSTSHDFRSRSSNTGYDRSSRGPGDGWTCGSCQFYNFASRTTCLKCGPNEGKRRCGWNSGIETEKWRCQQCQFENFASRTTCYKCGPSAGKRWNNMNTATEASDWMCPKCNFNNYASRTSCFKCGPSGGSSRNWNPRGGILKYPTADDSGSWCEDEESPSVSCGWQSRQPRPSYPQRNLYEDQQTNYNMPSHSTSGDSNIYSSKMSFLDSLDESKDSQSCQKVQEEGLIDWDYLKDNEEKFEAERWAHLPEIKKSFYDEDPAIKAMTNEEVQKFREENFNISVSLSNPENAIDIPNPVHTFNQAFHNYPEILKEIEKQGFEHPTPIQCQSWPILMKGHDMIGIAQTGTGKTLAFILPALIHIVHQPVPRWERPGPTCLVLAPTRELAQQIEKEVTKYQYQNIRCVVVYGQGDKRQQIRQINAKAEIVVATPGRLNEFSEKEIIDLSGVSYLVLDEADRMLDMGFEPQIRKIILDIRPDRQSILTSATWPEGVRSLAAKLLKDPIHVIVGSLDLQAASTVSQQVIICKEEEKRDKLLDFINRLGEEDKAIVFIGRKSMVDFLSVEMMEEGKHVQSMHGDREQEEREKALSDLKSGRVRVLLATDVAARGIDVIDITYILNFDCPRDMEEYVHRIGRTGRAGRQGHACTFITWKDWKNAGKLIEILEKSGEEVNRELYRMKERWEQAKEERGLQDRWGRYSHTAQREGGHRW
nr:probable ATP-dependent RNA helicase DDX43 [Penaeus vannamei]